MKWLAVLAVAGLIGWSWPTQVRADTSAERERKAAVHFERGVELYQEGSLDAALVEFERAYGLIPNYRLLFNLAQIQAERHQYVAAIELFERYLKEGGSNMDAPRRSQIKREVAKLRARLAHLWVDSDVDGAKLFVDGLLVARLPLAEAVPINPGLCELRLEKEGYRPVVRSLKVASGERPRIALSMQPLSEPGPMPLAADHGVAPNYVPAWISSAATVALGGASLAFGLLARDADQDLDAELNRFPGDSNRIDAARTHLRTYSAVTDGLAAASVVALGLSLYFWIRPPVSQTRESEVAAGRSVKLLPGKGTLVLHASF